MSFGYTITPVVSSFTVTGGTTHNLDFGGTTSYVQIQNETNAAITVKLNGLNTAALSLAGDTVQIFNPHDLQLTSLLFDNTASGAGDISIQVTYGVINF